MIRNRYFEAVVIFFLGLIIFTIGLSHQEVITFEARFYLFALEMWGHGFSFFPTTYEQPYPDYPVTSTALIYLFSTFFGGLSKFTAVLPSAIAASITLALTYLIGALHHRRWGFFAVCFLLFTATFLSQARTISLDMYIAAITTACFYLVYSASVSRHAPRLSFIFILLALGFAFRGPIGLIIPAGVLFIFYLLEKDIKYLLYVSIGAIIVFAASCAALFATAYHTGGFPFMQSVLNMEVFNRMQAFSTPPFYFYFVMSVGGYFITYPLAVLMLAGMTPLLLRKTSDASLTLRDTATRDLRFLKKLLGWAAIILIGLSIPADKKPRYILSIAPALALFCAYLFMLPRQGKGYLIYLRRLVYTVSFLFPALGLCILYYAAKKDFPLHYEILFCFFVVMQISVILYSWLSRRRDLLVFLTATVSFIVITLAIVEPVMLELNRTRDFVIQIESARHQANAQLIFYQEASDGLPIKYIIDMQEEDRPLFIDNVTQLSAVKTPVFFIATEKNFKKIPEKTRRSLQILYRGKIGHVDVVIFSKIVSHRKGAS